MVKKMNDKLYFSIYSNIQQGKNLTQISKDFGLSKQAINHYTRTLKQQGFIEKIGFGSWRVLKPFSKVYSVVIGQTSKVYESDSIRGHAFMFKLQLPANFRHWDKRASFLKENNIEFIPYKVGGIERGQALKLRGFTIYLTSKHIIFQTKESFFAENTKEAKNYALFEFLEGVKALENLLKANFSFGSKYKFKVSRQHYALIKNSLAEQYNRENKKLFCYADKGLWLVIDNSLQLNELEGVHKETADLDTQKVQNFFNGLKKHEGFTPEFILESLGRVTENQRMFDSNFVSHLAVIQELGAAVRRLSEKVEEFSQHIKKEPKSI
jgi:hypothetical protein